MQKKRLTKEQELQLEKKCHAIKENGFYCRQKSINDEVFCYAHLRQGFGLFTLAVLHSVRETAVDLAKPHG